MKGVGHMHRGDRKPDAERESGYQDRDRKFIEQRLTAMERRFSSA